ncbi:MAG: sulfotransferase [Rhizomicrobium sp.]
MSAQAFFIVSSGRSGTAMLHKALLSAGNVDMHHEYMVQILQPLAVRRYHDLISHAEAKEVLSQTHGAAVHYCEREFWGDSSNKLSWLIPELSTLLPEAKFVHLVRDGRKVTGSYFRKLGAECYDDRSSLILARHLSAPERVPPPPPEKQYWWPQAKSGNFWGSAFGHFSQFERIAWHWCEVNQVILDALASLPAARHHFVRLEDIHDTPDALYALLDFLGLRKGPDLLAMFQRPHNVNRPEDQLLNPAEAAAFTRIAEPMMQRLGYGERAEYVVNY